jgi:replicative DNA helicase
MDEFTIIKYLFKSDVFYRRIMCSLEIDFFKEHSFRNMFKLIKLYNDKKMKHITIDTFKILLDKTNYEENTKNKIYNILEEIESFKPNVDIDILEEAARKWIRKTALTDAILDAAELIEQNSEFDSIPDTLTNALKKGLSFPSVLNIDDPSRFDNENDVEGEKIRFHLETFNRITNGGAQRKNLCCIVAPPGSGKSRLLGDLAVGYKRLGNNVLVVSLEISKQEYAKRIDANIADMPLSELNSREAKDRLKEYYTNRRIKDEGILLIEEFPARTINKNNILALLDNLKMTQDFVPDVIVVDYLNLMNSVHKIPMNDTFNQVKFVAEELRAIAQEFNYLIWTATQFNREGIRTANSPTLENISESFGLANTLDFLMGLYIDEELDAEKQILCTILKTRYGDKFDSKSFRLGLEKSRMRHFDLEGDFDDEIVKSAETRMTRKFGTNYRKVNPEETFKII